MRTKLLFIASTWVLASAPLLLSQGSMAGISMSNAQCGSPSCVGLNVVPYTAQFKTTHTQVLADGTTISRVTTNLEARDSQRRTLHVTTSPDPNGGETPVIVGNIFEPAGMNLSWDSTSKTVRQMMSPALMRSQGCGAPVAVQGFELAAPPDSSPASPPRNAQLPDGPGPAANAIPAGVRNEIQQADLGTTMIAGVEAKGTRITTTIPTGRIGNDRPIVTTMEFWTAPSVGLQVRSVTKDPRNGDTTREMTSYEPGEPDPSLFEPPQDYRIAVQKTSGCRF